MNKQEKVEQNIKSEINESNSELETEEVKEEKLGKKILNFVIKTMNGMAYGLFSTLIIGTIIGTIAKIFPEKTVIRIMFDSLATVLKMLTGVGIGLGIARSLKLDGIKLIVCCVAGGIASYAGQANIWHVLFSSDAQAILDFTGKFKFQIGDPLTVYVVVVCTALLSNVVLKKKTPVDIIIVPLFVTTVAMVITVFVGGPISYVTTLIGNFVNVATEMQPFIMGILIAVVMGMALTAPISSAAIAVALSLNGLAGGAAVVGCCVQMVGFAVMSRKDNNIGTVISVGIGTSMLQFKNILKKPIIWLPTIIVSAILGPIATCVLGTCCTPSGAGMGTSGLVGIIGVIDYDLGTLGYLSTNAILSIVLLLVVLPIVLVWGLDIIFRKYNLIKTGDLKI